MADPLSISASVLAVTTAAVASIRSLYETVKSFENRNKTLKRLRDKLHDLATILDSLVQVMSGYEPVLALLEGPVDRCKEVCSEFEQSMKRFHGRSRTSILDWTKMEFMRGDINDFIETIEGYKSTIAVGLGTINLRNTKTSLDVLQQYEEMIKDTVYNLEVHLQQIDDKLTRYHDQDETVSDISTDLQDEKAVTQQCLRICKDASTYIESLTTRESTLLQDTHQANAATDTGKDFEAQRLAREALSTSQATFSKVIDCLGQRLQSVILHGSVGDDKERLRLQEDLEMSKQCLEVCKVASEISHQKIHTIGQVVAEDNSDQVVVTTLADLFDVRSALSKGHSAQLVATLTPENFDHVVDKRYDSRFGAVRGHSTNNHAGNVASTISPDSRRDKQPVAPEMRDDVQSPGTEARRSKPGSNEVRKRHGSDVDRF